MTADFVSLRIQHVPDEVWRQWDAILDETPELHSPFLRPAMTRLFSAEHDDVFLAYKGGADPAFFPYQAESQQAKRASAMGMGLLEWQGLICRHPRHANWAELMRAMGWRSLAYDHISSVQLQSTMALRGAIQGEAPWMDLSNGYEHYLATRRSLGGSLVKQTQRKSRKLSREIGKVTFEDDAPLDEAMDCLLKWKQEQHERTGVVDAFSQDWLLRLLRSVAGCREANFRGRLSLLRAGDRPVAVHLGIESGAAAHMWYPAYDQQFGSYSPGNILFLEMAKAMAQRGIGRFDFGPGGQMYKDRFKTDDDWVSRGVQDASAVVGLARLQWMRVQSLLRTAKRQVLNLGTKNAQVAGMH